MAPLLPAQTFSGNPLNRANAVTRVPRSLAPSSVSLVVVAGRQMLARGDGQRSELLWLRGDQLGAALAVDLAAAQATWAPAGGRGAMPEQSPPAARPPLPLYLLGEDEAGASWTFALDVSTLGAEQRPAIVEALAALPAAGDAVPADGKTGGAAALTDLRTLLPALTPEACALSGQAVALSQWHQAHQFCNQCGAPTAPSDMGARRTCTRNPSHRQYPRTDPVVIMLLESADGSSCLLGRGKRGHGANMLTCLAGFADQCETVEEAVAREVFEEVGIEVADVQILGTQAWPIGRAGSCELMIGCCAKARTAAITLNTVELATASWVSKADVAKAVAAYKDVAGGGSGTKSIADCQAASMEAVGFFIPGPYAIAHHLLAAWAAREAPWFGVQPKL